MMCQMLVQLYPDSLQQGGKNDVIFLKLHALEVASGAPKC